MVSKNYYLIEMYDFLKYHIIRVLWLRKTLKANKVLAPKKIGIKVSRNIYFLACVLIMNY